MKLPSPALAVSLLALVIACGGTAYAATAITSSGQIKNGVITGLDIKNGSVRDGDIAKGAISPSRLSKATLNRIDAAATTKAATGTTAAAGAAVGTIYEARRTTGPENQPPKALVDVAKLTVPAGAYLVTAKTVMTALPPATTGLDPIVGTPNSAIGGNCKLDAAGDPDQSYQNVVTNNNQSPATLFMQITKTVDKSSDFVLSCTAGINWRLSDTVIIATPAAKTVRTALP